MPNHTHTHKQVIELLVENELSRLDWLCTNDRPCLMVVNAEDNLPYGWVRVSDDYNSEIAICDAVALALLLSELEEGHPYAEFDAPNEKPNSSQNWPKHLMDIEQIEEGTPNDNPNHLITVVTNSGIRYAAGPHGVSVCALAESLNYGALEDSRDGALATLAEDSPVESDN